MRFVEQRPSVEPLKLTPDGENRLRRFLDSDLSHGLTLRTGIEDIWTNALRLYEAQPSQPVRNFPFENASNIEISVAGIATDAIYANALDLIFSLDPPITVRAVSSDDEEAAEGLQRFVNWMVRNQLGLREAAQEAILDDVKLGTGLYYTIWSDTTQKRKTANVTNSGPRTFPVPPEDFFIEPSGKGDIQQARWIAIRFWLSKGELEERGKALEWDTGGVATAGQVSAIAAVRDEISGTSIGSPRLDDTFEVFDVYCHFDIDDDGLDEDLLVTWDRTSRRLLKVQYNPYAVRPFNDMRYQRRGHKFYGIGVPEMIAQYQKEITDTHNHRMDNMMVANTRIWKARHGVLEQTRRLVPGQVVHLDDPTSLVPEQMGEVYQSAIQAEALTLRLAEQRVGLSDLVSARTSGSRVPGITALSLLGQANKRFTAAFDGMRIGTAGCARQGLYRYQEQLRQGNSRARAIIERVIPDKAEAVIGLISRDDFDEHIDVQLTATSAVINKEADRQSSLMLVQVMTTYYEKIIQLVALIANPGVPPQVKAVLQKAAHAATNLMEKTMSTFDQIPNPAPFLVNLDELETDVGGGPQGEQLLDQLLGGSGVENQQGGPPLGVVG